LKAVELLVDDTKKKIKGVPLSKNTVKARVEKMAYDMEEQLLVKIKNFPYFVFFME